MFTTVFPVWGASLLISLSCWSVGAALVKSRSPVVAMLAGWCVYLLLCTAPWILGFAAHDLRVLFWLFFAAGLILTVKHRRWQELALAAVGTGAAVLALGAPFLRIDGLLAYGAHGTDMWGYVSGAEWLQSHAMRDLPAPGTSPMRFNWIWHVFNQHERPLIYESLACLASSTGLEVVHAYLAYPVALIASLAVALAREPRLFRFKFPWLALPFTLAAAFHPLVILPWIAGYAGSAVAALCLSLALAAAVIAGDGEARSETLALVILMICLSGVLYAEKLIWVALALAGAELVLAALTHLRTQGWRLPPFPAGRLFKFTVVAGVVVLAAAACWHRGSEQPIGSNPQHTPSTALAHLLGIFGGTSPYVWMHFLPTNPFNTEPLHNPVGALALVVTLALFAGVTLNRWQTARDLRVPLVVFLCFAVFARSYPDEGIMLKALTLFGFGLLIILAAASPSLRRGWAGLFAAVVCALPCARSGAEIREIIATPPTTSTVANVRSFDDGDGWRTLCCLHFTEDRTGIDWIKYPHSYFATTHFLPLETRQKIAAKYHLPPP